MARRRGNTDPVSGPPAILVADDEPVALEAMTRLLEREGYRVLAAEDGRRALALLREHRPPLALLDVMMPGMSGTEVVAAAREDDALRFTMLVLLSSLRTSPSEQAKGLDAGADGYIARPIPNSELLARVRSFLRQQDFQVRLGASEARYRELITQQPDGVLVVDPEGTIRFANPAARRLLPEIRDGLEGESFGFPVESEEPTEIEIRRPDGPPRVAEMWTTKTEWDGDLAWLVTLRDLTFRREAEKQLRQQAALLEKARDAILVWDLDGTLTFWNPAAAELYGWGEEEAVGSRVEELLAMESPSFLEAHDALMRDGEWSAEVEHTRKDGTSVTVDARWTLIRDDDGEALHILAIHTDVTEKKRLMAQFLRAQRMESIGTLAGGIAHDLNNVLAPILMSIGLLKMDAEDPDTLETLSTIESSARRGAALVQQVLTFSRGVEGERLPIRLPALLGDLGTVVRDTFPRSIRFEVDVEPGLRRVIGDPTQVHQILLNLAVNARDAMPEGGTLRVAARNVELDERDVAATLGTGRPGHHVQIAVSDTGIGMTRETQGRIFDPFFTTKEVGKGTGLGLSTVATIVKSHGGIVRVSSVEGEGTTFTIWLPAGEVEDPGPAPDQESDPPRGGGELILLVDDDEAVRSVARRTLMSWGYDVVAAEDGLAAVEIFGRRGAEIDLVLTDVMMPNLDGPEMIQALRRIDPMVRVIAWSGLVSEGGLARARASGADRVLAKPYSAPELLGAIHEVLHGKGEPARGAGGSSGS